MKSFVVALLLVGACLPDTHDEYPILPGTNITPYGGTTNAPDAADVNLDGGLGDGGTFIDGGFVVDAGQFLDGPPPDAAALLPDAGTPFP